MFRHRDMARMANYCGNPAIGFSKETRFCRFDFQVEAARGAWGWVLR